ncbi:hypothetical protein C8R44DRAFT_893339 [Mycena epipterygia]|nr:hypothetical protein C8R44DRAFT_893339 [Mycena epipterygia]
MRRRRLRPDVYSGGPARPLDNPLCVPASAHPCSPCLPFLPPHADKPRRATCPPLFVAWLVGHASESSALREEPTRHPTNRLCVLRFCPAATRACVGDACVPVYGRGSARHLDDLSAFLPRHIPALALSARAALNTSLPPPAARCIGVFCVTTYCGEHARQLDNPLCVRAPTRVLPVRAADKPRRMLNNRLGAPSATRGACVGFVCVATHMAEDLHGAGGGGEDSLYREERGRGEGEKSDEADETPHAPGPHHDAHLPGPALPPYPASLHPRSPYLRPHAVHRRPHW